MGKQNSINFKNQIQKKKNPVIKLPRTGIDQPFLKDRPRFKETCREFEPIHQFNSQMSDEYARLDAEKLLNNSA